MDYQNGRQQSHKVGAIIVKDMSRLGRDYLQVGMYTDIVFPDNDIHFVAIKDNVDSENRSQTNDFTVILNLFNEFHARDTAKKVRDAKAVMGKSGKYLTPVPPYGYLKDPNNKEKWLVDEEAAKTIRHIYDLCIAGKGTSQIARILWKEKVPTPSTHLWSKGVKISRKPTADPCCWRDTTVNAILNRMEYLGCMVNFKNYKKSYKKKKSYKNPQENWVIFEDTHPAIIEKAQWERAQELCKHKRRLTKSGKAGLFSGIAYCAHCGSKLILTTSGHCRHAGGELRRQVRYGCHYKVRHPQSCDGQSGYGTTKLDALVEQAIISLFERIKDTPKEKLLSTEYESQVQTGKTALAQATKQYKAKTKELNLYKSEVKKVIAGTSSFEMELLNELIAETKEHVAAAELDMENAQADIDGYEQLSEKVTERYNNVVTWADLFSHTTIEAKKMIVAQFISQVRVGRDYHMEIDLNVNYEMFSEMLQEDKEEEKSA